MQDTASAHLFFGSLNHPSANGAFHYTRSGKSYILTKDSAVAKAWRILLATQPIISEQWEALCASPSNPNTVTMIPDSDPYTRHGL
ncbi:hypothetical protein JVU11DRAFT_5909 [Chiua virens]|nr:hypothetical protein JVU11DRAFT_5909 [Chiua virens]